MKGLIKAIIMWAFEEEVEPEPVYWFCRARPGSPTALPEHIHQYPYTEADLERYVSMGWMVSASYCLLPLLEFDEVDGDPAPLPMEVLDVTTNRQSGSVELNDGQQ